MTDMTGDRLNDSSVELQAEQSRLELERNKFVGLSLGEAKKLAEKLKIPLKVVQVDADAWYTSELRRNRITIDVSGGYVTAAVVG